MLTDLGMTIVHSDESLTVMYNPQTHQAVESEMPDGNIAISVRPKEPISELKRPGSQ